MTNKPSGALCKFGKVGDLFQKHGTWFSNHESLRKQGIVDPGTLLAAKFEQMFHRKLEEYDTLPLTKVDAARFKKELDLIIKSFQKGKIDYTKMGEWLWSTSERARTAPQMAEVHNDLLNIQHKKKGYELRANQLFSRIIDSLEMQSISQEYHTKSIAGGLKSGWKGALKKATDLQLKINDAQADAWNVKPGGEEQLYRLVREQDSFVQNGEGRVFNDFINLIEKELPKLQEKIEAKRGELLKKGIKNPKIKSEKLEDLFTEITDSPHMRRALTDYVEYTDFLWTRMELGIDAYVKSVLHGIEAKGFTPNSGKYLELKDVGKKLKESLMPSKEIGYFPRYNPISNKEYLEGLMPHMQHLAEKTRESIMKNDTDIDGAIKGMNGYISKRAKHRKKESDEVYSRNFPAVLKNYSNEIIRFNYVNHTQEVTRRGLLEVKKMYKDGKIVDGYGVDLIQQIIDLNQAQLGETRLKNPEMEAILTTIGNVEYMSKIGANVRTPAKNAFQRMLEWVFFGKKGIKESRRLYELDPKLKQRVDNMADEAGFKFEATAKELEEVTGAAFSQRIKVSGLGEIEFTKPSALQKAADFTGKLAGSKVMSGMMQGTENWNRRGTFRVSFSKMYNDLMKSPVFAQKMAAEGITGTALNKKIESMARNYAIKMVTMLHFDYSAISKSKAMRSPAGRIILQFQHWGQKSFELTKQVYQDAALSIKKGDGFSGKMSSNEMMNAYRFSFLYLLAPAILTSLTGTTAGNLIEFGPGEKAEQLAAIFTGDDDEIQKATYGRGFSSLLGFPAFSDTLAYGELMELWDFEDEDWLKMLVGFNDYADATGDEKFSKLLRTINAQAGRLHAQTIPLLLNGRIGMALQSELSLYPLSKKKRQEQINIIKGVVETVNPDATNELNALISEITSGRYN